MSALITVLIAALNVAAPPVRAAVAGNPSTCLLREATTAVFAWRSATPTARPVGPVAARDCKAELQRCADACVRAKAPGRAGTLAYQDCIQTCNTNALNCSVITGQPNYPYIP